MRKLKSICLPAAIVLMGVGAALVTHAAKSSQSTETGYYFDSSASQCVATDVQCSPTGTDFCTWSDGSMSHNLSRQINETICGDPLFKSN